MAFCPNCGSPTNDGAKFCNNCGGALPITQPQAAQPATQPVQPQQQPQPQPVQQQPVIIQQPIVQPVIQPVVQPVQSAPKEKTNGFCSAGFVLSLLGVFLFGITTLFGLIFSIVGLISASKKKQKGKGKAIAGIILALLMVIVGVAVYFVLKTDNPISDFLGSNFGFNLNYEAPDYEDYTTKDGWVLIEDESYIEFNSKKNTLKYCKSYLEKEDFYASGHYEMFTGKKAFNYLTKSLGDSGLTKDELDDLIDDNDRYLEDSLIAITCDYEKYIFDGEVLDDFEPRTTHLYGFYTLIVQGENVFDAIEIYNLESGGSYTLIKESQFRYYVSDMPDTTDPTGEITETTDWTDPTDETGYTDPTDETEPTEITTSDDENIVGDSITGTVTLPQGKWAVWQEADGGLNDSIKSRYQRINMETQTIINLTVFDFDSLAAIADSTKQSMESEGAVINIYGQDFIGGYPAYAIIGQYQDGMFLAVWMFTDNNNNFHYISVEYYENDYIAYEMVRDTYTLD